MKEQDKIGIKLEDYLDALGGTTGNPLAELQIAIWAKQGALRVIRT